jgi:hypothetical protein
MRSTPRALPRSHGWTRHRAGTDSPRPRPGQPACEIRHQRGWRRPSDPVARLQTFLIGANSRSVRRDRLARGWAATLASWLPNARSRHSLAGGWRPRGRGAPAERFVRQHRGRPVWTLGPATSTPSAGRAPWRDDRTRYFRTIGRNRRNAVGSARAKAVGGMGR